GPGRHEVGRVHRAAAEPAPGGEPPAHAPRDRHLPGGLMDSVNLGATGLRVSRVCLGVMSYGNDSGRPWVLDEEATEPFVRAAVENGIFFFDTADTYSSGASEVATGRIVPKYLSRDEAVIATKVFMPMTPGPNGGGLSRKHILSAIDASLQRLELDHLDMQQIPL